MNITATDMYRVCNKYNFFTHGSNYQYDRLFDVVRADSADLMKIATIIWVCSEQSYEEVYNTLVKEFC